MLRSSREWLERVLEPFADPRVGAVQGRYVAAGSGSLFSRVMALDLEQRYAHLSDTVDHVCTGNSAYRVSALEAVGLLNEDLGYGYDNDLSYRLGAAGYRLIFRRDARSRHSWRDGVVGYLTQQYGFGYGRLDVVAAHPTRIAGDAVSPAWMMAQPVITAAALICFVAALSAPDLRRPLLVAGLVLAGAMAVERLVAGMRRVAAFQGPRGAGLSGRARPAEHGVGRGHVRVGLAAPGGPPAESRGQHEAAAGDRVMGNGRTLAVIPAHNEAANLAAVVAGIRTHRPDLDILVVNDGSTDQTAAELERLGARWLGWPLRRGVGCAVRAGLRYGSRLGFDVIVRLDADGQHDPRDIDALLAPLRTGQADAVLGSRYVQSGRRARTVKRALAAILSFVSRRGVTDATSGFWALGPRAVALLATHHPRGYPEPELLLLLSRNGLRVAEVPVRDLERRGGRSSLTPSRLLRAAARVLLAIIIVPLRQRISP